MSTTSPPQPDVGSAVRRYGLYIDGAFVEPASGEYLEVVYPYDGQTWAEVPAAGVADVDRAVASARRAFDDPSWRDSLAADRARCLRRLGDLTAEHAEELARLQVLENGKLIRESLGQMRLLPDYFYYYAGLAMTMGGTTNSVHLRDMVNYTVREPIGVVAAITPWNSPLLLLAWKLGPALAAGNSVIAKPSEKTPVTTLEFARLVSEAGVPPGVFNVVTGFGELTGCALTTHPGVDKVAFTGSTPTGRAILEGSAKHLTRVSLELGGKSPNIVFADADLEIALNGVVAGIFGASGQTCMAGSRVLVEDVIYDRFVADLVKRARLIKIGDPLDPETEMGTVASRAHLERVLAYVDVARADGARVAAGGRRASGPGLDGGLFVEPTVFADVTNDMRVAREEIFGPVASVLRFRDEAEALQIANDTDYGLAAGVWTSDMQRAHRFARRLRAGTVWVNNYRKTSYATPFGGYKQSGLGRENGPDALHEYTEVKSVWIDAGLGVRDPFNPRA